MKYELAIFDLDGTILDTLEDLTDATNYALTHFHMNNHSVDEVRAFVGNGIHKLIERAVEKGSSDQLIDQVEACFKQYYGIHCADKTKPYDGIIDLVNSLRASGMKCAVVSNKADYAVQILVNQYFPNVFDFALGEKAEIRKKPAADMVNCCLKQLNVDREKSVYIGDSEVDIQTAFNANMDCISCCYGFRSREFLKENGASVIVSSTEELYEVLR